MEKQHGTQPKREVVDKAEAEIQLGALKEELELIKKTRRDPDEIRLAVTAVELAISSGSTNSGSIIATARAILQFILEDIPEEKKP